MERENGSYGAHLVGQADIVSLELAVAGGLGVGKNDGAANMKGVEVSDESIGTREVGDWQVGCVLGCLPERLTGRGVGAVVDARDASAECCEQGEQKYRRSEECVFGACNGGSRRGVTLTNRKRGADCE